MTTLGIEMTDRDPTPGWESVKPKPGSVFNPPELIKAREDMEKAWMQYYDAIDRDVPVNVMDYQRSQALEYERIYTYLYHKYNALECDHSLPEQACPACTPKSNPDDPFPY